MSYQEKTRPEFFCDQTLYLKPILAFRNWRVILTNNGLYRLASLTAHTESSSIWPIDKEFQAKCHAFKKEEKRGDDLRVPMRNCLCGIHGTYIAKKESDPEMLWVTKGTVYGKMKCWGKIVEHKKEGVIRAEYAYPISLAAFVCRRCGELYALERARMAIVLSSSLHFYCGNTILYFYCSQCPLPVDEFIRDTQNAKDIFAALAKEDEYDLTLPEYLS